MSTTHAEYTKDKHIAAAYLTKDQIMRAKIAKAQHGLRSWAELVMIGVDTLDARKP